MTELQNSIEDTLDNKNFSIEASKPISKWIDVDYQEVKEVIIEFINKL